MRKQKYITLSECWTTYYPDGNLKDFGMTIIKHKESYAEWNDKKQDWDYIIVPCNCKICKKENQKSLFDN